MAGPFPYQWGFGSTPAPAFDLALSWRGKTRVVRALVDSGASGTTIPTSVVSELALRKISEARVSGAIGSAEPRSVYVVDLDFVGVLLSNHPVVALAEKEYALIGRDILNRYVTTLNGPALEFSVA